MDYFHYQSGELFAEDVALSAIAHQFGTPCYVYSRAILERHWYAFDDALATLSHQICYAVKANSNLAVLNVLARLGAGFDIVSAGELARVIAAGGKPSRTIFSGVGKTAADIKYALDKGIGCFNVESTAELERINDIADNLGVYAPVSIRVNPDIDPQTHPYISTGLKENKFGIAIEQAEWAYLYAQQMSHVQIVGIDCHIGSQLTIMAPFVDALTRILALVDRLAELGIQLSHLNIGGGLGITYHDEQPPSPGEYASALTPLLLDRELTLLVEPGRAISGNAGLLVTRVEYIKVTQDRRFAIVDAAMNDLLRPALYQSWHAIRPVVKDGTIASSHYDVVGPVCETADFLGKDRRLAIRQGDLLAVHTTGAYGFTMSSNYNSRPRVAEVMVDHDSVSLVRSRENIESLYANEKILAP